MPRQHHWNDVSLDIYIYIYGLQYRRLKNSSLKTLSTALLATFPVVRIILVSGIYFVVQTASPENHTTAYFRRAGTQGIYLRIALSRLAHEAEIIGLVLMEGCSSKICRSVLAPNGTSLSTLRYGVRTSCNAASSDLVAVGKFLMACASGEAAVICWPSRNIRFVLPTAIALWSHSRREFLIIRKWLQKKLKRRAIESKKKYWARFNIRELVYVKGPEEDGGAEVHQQWKPKRVDSS